MALINQEGRDRVIERFARHVSRGKVDYFRGANFDFVMGRREGIFWYDMNGRKLIDCHCNGGVFNLGHRHPRIVGALLRAVEELDIGNHHFISEQRALLAEKLASVSPGDLNRVVFGVSGGEAVDAAIKLARGCTGRPGILYADGGYHGHTGLALAAGDESYRAPFEPLSPGFRAVPFGDLDALDAAVGDDTAAVLLETIPATLGIVIPPDDYFAGVRKLCDERGALLICDEVQSGLGRCGSTWAIEQYEVVPDILVTGKGLSGGLYPITATIYRDALDEFFRQNPFIHVSTFGGAEVGCRVALEVLKLVTEPSFLEHVRQVAFVFERGLQQLQRRHPRTIVSIRQKGLMIGLKMASSMCGPYMTVAGLHHGLLTVYANHDPSVSQILPPLIIREKEAEDVLVALDHMLAWIKRMV